MGYVVAEEIDGEFWTSDQRFANAARNAGLTRVRLVP
jgi:predicted nucleic acid-binding protein